MKKITEEELQMLLENINRNMKIYNDDIKIRMEQSDRAELRHIQLKGSETSAHKRAYAGFKE